MIFCISLYGCNSLEIYVSENNIEVELNKELTLNKKYNGEMVRYESNDQEKLSISNYKLTANEVGTYVINVYSVN